MAKNKHTEQNHFFKCESMFKMQSVISGKWKILIIWYIYIDGVQRFGELQRKLEGITQSTLTKQLRELESDNFIFRQVYPEVPPKVEYRLTELGQKFVPILLEMQKWSETNLLEK